MNLRTLFESDQLSPKDLQFKQALETIIQLANDAQNPLHERNYLAEIEQQNLKIQSLMTQLDSIKEENLSLRRKSNLVDHLNADITLHVEQNRTLVNVVAQTQEEKRLLEAKNEHLRKEFSTKINLLNASIKDHKANYNALELEKKKADKELVALRHELLEAKIALAKKES